MLYTLREESKYGVLSGPYFPVFSPNTGKCGLGKTPYLDTFYAVASMSTMPEKVMNKVKKSCKIKQDQ